MQKRPPNKISFADLGLTTALPPTLLQTKEQVQEAKYTAKKERERRTREALAGLAADAPKTQGHRQFVEEQQVAEKAAKQERKRLLDAEHVKAQNQRRAVDKHREAELVQQQQVIAAEMCVEQKRKDKKEKALRRAIQKQIEEDVKVATPAVHIDVHRSGAIEEQRRSLPVMAEEQPIIEAINESRGACVLICGETGSGKTTQIPQFLWEAGYGHEEGTPFGRQGIIAVTEPRRVAATSMARRVAEELNEPFGGTVCYQVRYDHNLSQDCRLKFVTEGILLKEIQSDFLLRKYSAIIVDEAHERSISCDILVGLLSRIVPTRQQLYEEYLRSPNDTPPVQPLKFVIMSATMRVSDFRDNTVLFPKAPPLLNVEARRFPVSAHFSRKTELFRYVEDAAKKVRQVHKKLPPGGILVFLSTQREIEQLSSQLAHHYRNNRIRYEDSTYRKHALLPSRRQQQNLTDDEAREDGVAAQPAAEVDEFGLEVAEYALEGDEDCAADDVGQSGLLPTFRDDFDYKVPAIPQQLPAEAPQPRKEKRKTNKKARAETSAGERWIEEGGGEKELEGADSDHDGAEGQERGEYSPAVEGEDEEDGAFDTLHILPLYSLLSAEDQQKVFMSPPAGKRLCVIATNVAETSITIPGIRYVIDTGRVKVKTLDRSTGACCYRIEWTSQASSEQRLGRAGRTGPGHCYRLYSTAVFANRMPKHSAPEILRTPLESIVLMMKQLKIDHVANFPFPSPPPREDIGTALEHLVTLRALDDHKRLTSLGSELVQFPIAPRYARMVVAARELAGNNRADGRILTWLVVSAVAVASNTLDIFEHGSVEQLRRKQQQEGGHAQAADHPQKKLIHVGSDFISYVKALAVVALKPTAATCREHCIIHKTMTEAIQLQRQILREVDQRAAADDGLRDTCDDDGDSRTPLSAPPVSLLPGGSSGPLELKQRHEVLLRKAFATGLIDQIARRASVHECRSRGIVYTDGKATKVPYFVIRTATIAYIHPASSCAGCHPPPEFVAYAALQQSRRLAGEDAAGAVVKEDPKTFMKGVTTLTRQWLNEIGFDEEAAEKPSVVITD